MASKTIELESLEGNTWNAKVLWEKGKNVLLNSSSGQRITPITRITSGRGGTIYIGNQAFDSRGNERGGDTWSRTSIQHITPEQEAEIRKTFRVKKLIRRLEKLNWNNVPEEKIEAVCGILKDTPTFEATKS